MDTLQTRLKRITAFLKQHHDNVLAATSFLIYAVLILEKLAQFPIYFFCDEAMLGVDAAAILKTGLSSNGERWPVFFRELGYYSHSISVYLNMPTVWLFGLNEFAVRLTTAMISFLGVIAVYALVRWVFRLPFAWLVFLVFAVSPLWFLHSRTGFEYIMAASFFLAFGLCYIFAFSNHHWVWVLPCALCGAATFYAHTTGRGWVGVTLALWFFLTAPECLRQWRRLLIGILMLFVLLAPYLYVQTANPEIAFTRLEGMKQYFHLTNLTVPQQIQHFWKNYSKGMHPAFWFTWAGTQNTGPMERHIIPPLSPLLKWTFPLACLGLGMLIIRFRRLESRVLLSMFLAAPSSASLIEFNIHRGITVGVFWLVFACIGAGQVFLWLQRWPRVRTFAILAIGFSLSGYAVWFRHYVYHTAPYKYRDYGFFGIQMGQPEVFTWIREHQAAYDHILLSPDLFNAGHIFIPFYLQGAAAQKTKLFDMNAIYRSLTPLPEKTAYIVPMAFLTALDSLESPIDYDIAGTILDKRGAPLFQILSPIRREAGFARWFEQMEMKRRVLQPHRVMRNKVEILVEFPQTDLGEMSAIFDGDPLSLTRTDQVNPAMLRIHLPPTTISRIRVALPHLNVQFSLQTTSTAGRQDWGTSTIIKAERLYNVHEFKQATPLEGVTLIELNIRVTDADQYGHVHVNEIDWE